MNKNEGNKNLTIWVDADACPKLIKEVLYRSAKRLSITTVFVANQALSTPASPFIVKRQVEAGFDIADQYICDAVQPFDLVITADIPLADQVITKGAVVLTPRGESLTTENIKQKLSVRDFMTEMRGAGLTTGGPPPLNNQDKTMFANALDRLLTKQRR